MSFICKFCESTEFNIVDGWYYCDDCHRQNFQEFEFDAFGLGATGILKKTKIQDASSRNLKNVADKTELTSWESFNYILRGLVEELIVIGVKPEVKLTVFQMWSHYLKQTEVAFFNKQKPALPKLPPIFSKRDADILYNHQRRAKKRRRSASTDGKSSTATPTTNRARLRKIARLVDQSQRSEYQSELNETKTDINRTLTSLADVSVSDIRNVSGSSIFGTESVVSSLAIEFSQYARSAFKKKVPKRHIAKHAEDFKGELKCHTLTYNDVGTDSFKLLTRKTLFGILYCALNYHKEPYEIGDLIRFCREGHLSFNCAKKFIPRNLSEQEREKLNNKYTLSRLTEVTCHTGWRFFVFQMKKYLEIELEQPDLFSLSQRYVDDLNLPKAVYTYVERMLVLCPPNMESNHFVPTYEARAMAFILFVLKLLFGVDDRTEREMSEASKALNNHLARHDRKMRLFVWSEWVEFLEARSCLIEKCHAPSFIPTSRQSTVRFLEHIHVKTYQADEEESSDEVPKDKENLHTKVAQQRESMLHFAKSISEVDENRDIKLIERDLIAFPPSLTPNKTYLEIIRENYANKVQIPPVLLVNHATRDVKSYLDPVDLYKEVLQTRTKLELEEASMNSQLKFMRWTNDTRMDPYLQYDVLNFKIGEEEWTQKLKEDLVKHEASFTKDARRTHERRHRKFLRRKEAKLSKKADSEPDQPLFDPGASQETTLPETCPSQYDSTLALKLPHFHYWTHSLYSLRLFYELDQPLLQEVSEDLPKSFMWLLNHCAKMIEVTPSELYSQLLLVENQFLFVLKPMNKVKTEVKYRSKKELPRKMFPVINKIKDWY